MNIQKKKYTTIKGLVKFIRKSIESIYPFTDKNEKINFVKQFDILEKSIIQYSKVTIISELKRVIGTLNNSHTVFEEQKNNKYYLKNKIRLVGNKLAVEKDSHWYEIVKINNQLPSDFLKPYINQVFGGTKQLKIVRALDGINYSEKSGYLEFVLKDKNNIRYKQKYSHLVRKSIKPSSYVSSFIKNGIGVLAINSWSDRIKVGNKSILELANDQLDKLSECKNIIIDVRNNGGGNSRIATSIAGRFANRKLKYLTIYKRVGDKIIVSNMFIKPVKPYLNRNLLVLTGPKCFSSNEIFISSLKDTGLAKTVGNITGGGSGNPQFFDIEFNNKKYWFQVSTWKLYRNNDLPIEGKGIVPDVEINQSINDLNKNKDTILEKSLEILRPLS